MKLLAGNTIWYDLQSCAVDENLYQQQLPEDNGMRGRGHASWLSCSGRSENKSNILGKNSQCMDCHLSHREWLCKYFTYSVCKRRKHFREGKTFVQFAGRNMLNVWGYLKIDLSVGCWPSFQTSLWEWSSYQHQIEGCEASVFLTGEPSFDAGNQGLVM